MSQHGEYHEKDKVPFTGRNMSLCREEKELIISLLKLKKYMEINMIIQKLTMLNHLKKYV